MKPQPPPNYEIQSTTDLREGRSAVAIQAIFVLTAGAMVGLAAVLDLPLESSWSAGATAAVTVAACVVYMVVHELTHGLFMGLISGQKPTYRVRLPYLATGSEAFFDRSGAVIVALAPAVFWGLVLTTALFVVPPDIFLPAYVVTGLNFAGSAGDYVQARAISKLPPGALIQDNGRETTAFVPR